MKYRRKKWAIYNNKNQALDADTCFEMISQDRSYTVLLHPEWEVPEFTPVSDEETDDEGRRKAQKQTKNS